ncbi:MAG: metallophosphoesterase [Candidatus Neomarinimicrobiota bacterium]
MQNKTLIIVRISDFCKLFFDNNYGIFTMIWNSIRKSYFKLILISFLLINWGNSQEVQSNSFFDGPHCFYNGDSLIINYYNNGIKESFWLSKKDANIFHGYLQDSLVTYSVPNHFKIQYDVHPNVDKIFVVSDIHGQYEIFRKLLYSNGIIDKNNSWNFGEGHLVILGDVFDRGKQVHEALWLIYNLENQAREKGGMVHLILGNHEIMVLQNDLRYVDEKYFTISKLFEIDLHDLYNENTFWGRWLRSKNFITIIDSYLFVHGGIHPELINKYKSINEINRIMSVNIDTDRDKIKNTQELSGLFHSKGPIWSRGFFEPDTQPEVSEIDLTNILEHFSVEKIIVGHTTNDFIQSSYNQRIINVDGGIKYGVKGEGLLILKNQFHAVDSNGKHRLLF